MTAPRKLPCGHPVADLYRDPTNESLYRCPSCARSVGPMAPMDCCRWVEGTFPVHVEGGSEMWTGRVFLAVCAGGMQDPESCYCAEYAGKPRDTIRHLRDQLESMQETEERLAQTERKLGVALRMIHQLRRGR